MLGDHGIRSSLKHPEILKAEFQAIKNIAEKNPGKKLGIMFPQVISAEEITDVKKYAEEVGLTQLTNVVLGAMIETPASALIIKNIIKAGVQFISFGTNDLTQYILAIDRNNPEVQHIFDETHPAVLNAIKRVLRTCTEMGIESSICGQAGSKKEMAKFLIENGIDSISVNADAAKKISEYVAELESAKTEKDEPESKPTEQKATPEQKAKQVIQKIEGEIVKEIIQNPKQVLHPDPQEPRKPIPLPPEAPEKTPDYIRGKKPDAPTYVSNVVSEDQSALNALFGQAPPIIDSIQMEPEPTPEPIEADNPEPQPSDDEDEVTNIF